MEATQQIQEQPEQHSEQPQKGGSRSNAGRKKKYGEETKVLTMRLPASKVDDLKKVIDILIAHPEYMNYILHKS